MRLACIDIGSNTTRLLVAEVGATGVEAIEEHRAFTHLGRDLELEGRLSEGKLVEVLGVVREQLERARALGAREVHVVATAAVRRAANGEELVVRLREQLEVDARVLDPVEEARLAFLGAVSGLRGRERTVTVVDVGGGSCELAVGSPPSEVRWSTSLPVGSGTLTARHLVGDPPSRGELALARAAMSDLLAGIDVPAADLLIAVGGSATSLRRLGGARLDLARLTQLLEDACACSSLELAAQANLERERARLLPAGLLILSALAERLGRPIQIGAGGVREGVLIDAAR